MASNGISNKIFKIDEHPPTCPKCKEVFTFRYQLEWHFQWKHRKDGKLFVCGECNLAEIGESFCRLHIRTQHESAKCACEKCGLCFKTDLELRRHHLSHKEQRSFVCKMCSRSFLQKPTLERHTKLNCCAKSMMTAKSCRLCFSRRSFMVKHSIVGGENSGA